MKEKIKSLIKKFDNDRGRLMDILLDIQEMYHHIPGEAVKIIADQLELSKVDVEQTITFYHFFSLEPVGIYAIYLNDSPAAWIHGRADVASAFEKELGISFNNVTEDGLIGLWDTADIGMNDQEPAAIINGTVFTELDPSKAKKVIQGIKEGKGIKELAEEIGAELDGPDLLRTMVKNNIRKKGPVLFADYEVGKALKQTVTQTPEQIIDEIKESYLRGRGGAGFPTGLKWDFCRKVAGDEVYLICNADEGEPGTFKERVILTELPKLLFEGMAIAGYTLDAKQGIIYLRYEYRYMKAYLENVLQEMRDQNLLGKSIAGKAGFDFDIRIQLGAGAYVCGEESGLIESMEGKRGEPRNRPPFPVQKGYQDKPTVVNNVETLCKVVPIMLRGADWFKAVGTNESTGTKLLSISGDSCIDPSQFNRSIAFEDLATGGSMIVIGKDRDLLKDYVLNFMSFFIEETCGSCVPCRSLPVILRNKLLKIMDGNGTMNDIDELYTWSQFGKSANRCGLGQTAANPIITTIDNFRDLYEDLVKTDEEYLSTFNMEQAVAASCEVVGRVPNIKSH
jgi:[NiFe] hydrogenase diaphorase moiety large subunit